MNLLLKRTAVAAAIAAVALPAQALDLSAFKPRTLDGLWEFILPDVQASGGGPEDFAPRIAGLELLAIGAAGRCVAPPGTEPPPPGMPPSVVRFEYRDRRVWLTTDGVPLPTTIETPLITTTPGPNSCVFTTRVSTALPKAQGMRVYLNSRALVAPTGMFPDHSVWHISVFNLDGSHRWTRDFRPGGGADADPDDVGWSIIPGRSGVGDVLGFGDVDDAIRIYRQKHTATTIENRYTFLDVLTGNVIKDIRHTVERPVLVP